MLNFGVFLAQSEGRIVQDKNWFYSFIKKYVSLKNHVSIEKTEFTSVF